MAFFKKNTLLLDLMNKFNSMENKIDTLQSKLETVTFLDGCCNCSERETKIYNDLQGFLQVKFENMKNDILTSIPKDNNENLLDTIKQIITDTYDKNRQELTSLLTDICKKSNNDNNEVLLTEKQLQNHITTLYTSIIKSYSQFDERIRTKIDNLNTTVNTNDISLRNNLQEILISIKNDIIANINHNDNHNHTQHPPSNLDDFIKNITEQISTINNNVDGFYFENETIKHQFLLEEEIRGYNDEIDQMKILIGNLKSTIDITLKNNNFEQLKTKYQ